MGRTGVERAQAPPPTGWSTAGTVAAYAAAIVAFAYALVNLYWAAGGHGLVSTVGGYVEQFARHGGTLPVLVAIAAVVAKVAGGLLALALVRPRGKVVPRRWLQISSAGASALLLVYTAVLMWRPPPSSFRASSTPPQGWTGRRCAGTWESGTCGSWCGGFCWRWLRPATGARR